MKSVEDDIEEDLPEEPVANKVINHTFRITMIALLVLIAIFAFTKGYIIGKDIWNGFYSNNDISVESSTGPYLVYEEEESK